MPREEFDRLSKIDAVQVLELYSLLTKENKDEFINNLLHHGGGLSFNVYNFVFELNKETKEHLINSYTYLSDFEKRLIVKRLLRFFEKMNSSHVLDIANKEGWSEEAVKQKDSINSTNFKLYSLHIITRYKNLEDLEIDFQSTENYTAFIGLNGSGKSNVLEAISAIFHSLHQIATLNDANKYKCPFSYKISYIKGGEYYEIANGKQANGEKVTTKVLPKNIIASYSGEDTRLWEKWYKLIYERFTGKLTVDTQGFSPPFMFYIDKKQWEIAALALLYSEDTDVEAFVRTLKGRKKCTITFEYVNKNFGQWDGTNTGAFVDKLRDKASYSISEFRDLVNDISFIEQSSTLFYFLYRATVEEPNKKLISRINIKFGDGGDLEGLSEGEKKMILANTIIHILATEESLCLFDEPDSHIHISRKSELIQLIDTERRYSIVTTHSPTFVEKMRPQNIKYLDKGDIKPIEFLKHISDLSGGTINLVEGAFILSSKHIVVTEGTYDIKYIKKAIEVLSKNNREYEKLKRIGFIPMGSAGNVQSFFDDVIEKQLPTIDKLLYIFDYDTAGIDGFTKAEKFMKNCSKIHAIFYQHDYVCDYKIEKANSESNPLYVEDLFDCTCYAEIVDELHKKKQFKEFKTIKKTTHDRIKGHIEKGYLGFSDETFSGFKPMLDKMLNVLFPENPTMSPPKPVSNDPVKPPITMTVKKTYFR